MVVVHEVGDATRPATYTVGAFQANAPSLVEDGQEQAIDLTPHVVVVGMGGVVNSVLDLVMPGAKRLVLHLLLMAPSGLGTSLGSPHCWAQYFI